LARIGLAAGLCHCTDCQIWTRSQLPWLDEIAALPGAGKQH
jgi:hypothetical protein